MAVSNTKNIMTMDEDKAFEEDREEEEYDDNSWYDEDNYYKYKGSYAQDVMGLSDEFIDDVLDGDPEAYWNID